MYEKLLVPLDGSELAECVLPHVEALANGCSVKKVIFINVVEQTRLYISSDPYDEGIARSQYDPEESHLKDTALAEKYLAAVSARVSYQGVDLQSEVISGRAADSIADYATKNAVDLIVIATHGRSGISRWVWGSVADKVLRSSCVPVFIVRAPGCVQGI